MSVEGLGEKGARKADEVLLRTAQYKWLVACTVSAVLAVVTLSRFLFSAALSVPFDPPLPRRLHSLVLINVSALFIFSECLSRDLWQPADLRPKTSVRQLITRTVLQVTIGRLGPVARRASFLREATLD